VLGCLLYGLLVTHISVRYLLSTLHGFVTFRGVDPAISLVVLSIYTVSMVVLAVIAVIRQATAGGISGAGFLLFAAEPFTSALIFGDGCQVAAGSGSSLLPEVTIEGIVVNLSAWNGSCGTSLNTAVIAVGLLGVSGGLWMANVPTVALSRWLSVLEPYCPGYGVD